MLFYPTLGKNFKFSPSKFFFSVQCWMWQYHLGKFVIEKNLKSKVISEFYDVTGMYASSDDLSMVFPKHLIKQDFEYEKFILKTQMESYIDIRKVFLLIMLKDTKKEQKF